MDIIESFKETEKWKYGYYTFIKDKNKKNKKSDYCLLYTTSIISIIALRFVKLSLMVILRFLSVS